MSVDTPKFSFKKANAQGLWIRLLLGSVEFLIFCGALYWLLSSEQGRHLSTWIAVGAPLFLAYVFLGAYVRYRLGLIKPSGT